MDKEAGSVRIECEALPSNMVRMVVTQTGEQTADVEMPAREVASVAAALLSAIAAAGKLAGTAAHPRAGESIHNPPTIQPTGLGVMQGPDFNTSALVLQFGSARLAIRMADQEFRALGQALGALAAPRGLAQ
jgi:hypothetical protein